MKKGKIDKIQMTGQLGAEWVNRLKNMKLLKKLQPTAYSLIWCLEFGFKK
ncbi:MAG: hypothetical protein Fur0020_06020 [Thermodesulfovibrionia bacterium]